MCGAEGHSGGGREGSPDGAAGQVQPGLSLPAGPGGAVLEAVAPALGFRGWEQGRSRGSAPAASERLPNAPIYFPIDHICIIFRR